MSEGGWLALGLAILSGVVLAVSISLFGEMSLAGLIDNAMLSILTASVTAILFDLVQSAFERRRWLDSRLRDLSSTDAGFASRALSQLREKGVLENGGLNNCDLTSANLKGADLSGLVADNCTLSQAQLSTSDFRDCRLKDVSFRGADLRRALFSGAILTDCDFREALLDGAEFDNTNCQGSNFSGASSVDVNWGKAKGAPEGVSS